MEDDELSVMIADWIAGERTAGNQMLSVYELYQLGIRLRHKYKFFPSIAEVLHEIDTMRELCN